MPGVDWKNFDIIVVKQGYIHPELKAAGALCVMSLTDGATPQDTRLIPFKRIMRPMFPLTTSEHVPFARFLQLACKVTNRPGFLLRKPGRFVMLYSCFLKRSRNHLRGFLIAACSALYKQRVQESAYLRCLFFQTFDFLSFS